MSNHKDRYWLPSNVPYVGLQRATAHNVKTSIDKAIQRMQVAVSDTYEHISVFSIYWESDNTGGKENSTLFIQTISKLQNVQSYQRSLANDDLLGLMTDISQAAASQSGKRKLFVLHYAGHGVPGSTPDSLIIVPNTDQKLGGLRLNMSWIKDGLKDRASKSLGLDVLLVIDSCCAAIPGWGAMAKGARVELMTATARKGVFNTRADGRTFTQYWCKAFTTLLETGKPFTCADISKEINPHPELEQYPSAFVLREGWELPITFLHPAPISSSLSAAVTSRTVVTAFHIEENPDSPSLNQLIEYLKKAPVPIVVLAALPIASTLLLLRVPMFLQELIVLPGVARVLIDA